MHLCRLVHFSQKMVGVALKVKFKLALIFIFFIFFDLYLEGSIPYPPLVCHWYAIVTLGRVGVRAADAKKSKVCVIAT